MDVLTTYKVFLVKTLKEKKYYWARNVFFLLFPLLFIIIYLFTGTTTSSNSSTNNNYAHLSQSGRTFQQIHEVSITFPY